MRSRPARREDERRRAEALAELDRAKTAFFSNVSHEFRTPLTLMLGPLEEILGRCTQPSPRCDRASWRRSTATDCVCCKLVNALLDFSRIEAGRSRGPLRARSTSLPSPRELASNFRSAIDAPACAHRSIARRCPSRSMSIREMWEKIVLNLLSNAFKFTLEGSIERCAAPHRLHAALTSARHRCREFPRARFRASSSASIASRGARAHARRFGIGLALVKELVGLHRGTADVRSTLGEGTTFAVGLPLGKAHLPAERIVSARPAQRTTRRADAFVQEASQWVPSPDLPPSGPAAGDAGSAARGHVRPTADPARR